MTGPAELTALERKYRVMAELRRTLPPHPSAAAGQETSAGQETLDEACGDAPALDESARAALRALAAEFPGALRELDTLATEELERRRDALAHAAAGGTVEPWMEWMHGYHALMRAALAVKRRLARAGLDAEARAAIAAATGADVDEELVRAVAAPPHGRLNVVVFERLSALHGTPAREIWDALFPPRKGERAYRGR